MAFSISSPERTDPERTTLSPNDSIFNFAFTIAHSPYGPAYLKGIKRKLSDDSKNGLFIVGLDAWSIADSSEDPNDESQFDENKRNFKEIADYDTMNVSKKVVRIILSYTEYINRTVWSK